MNEIKYPEELVVKKNEIDFMILVYILWDGRKTILKGLAAGTILGLFFAIIATKEFTVTTVMLPQSESSGGMSKFSSLASLAGFDLNMESGSDITPIVYPKIVESESFMLDIMHSKYNFKNMDKPVSMFDYYTKYQKPGVSATLMKYTIGLPGVILNATRKDVTKKKLGVQGDLLMLSDAENKIMRALKGQIVLTVNKKEGYLTLACTFNEGLLAAQVTKRAQDLLQEKITGYKIKKSAEQLKFIEERYNETKAKYLSIQNRLADYRDRNLNMFLASANTEQERMVNEYNITYSVYSELAKQLEKARIQVKNDTPVFAVIKPVVVPLKKTKPNRFTILFVWMVLGLGGGVGFEAGKEYFKQLKKK